jgi:predicted enzyme related to lactoylglutathione lyase
MDAAIRAARAAGANVVVTPFDDPIGRDAVIQFPGGVNTQIYIHKTAPSYKPLETVPENRVYVSVDGAEAFVRSFLEFSHGRIVSSAKHAAGVEIGRPKDTFWRVRIESAFGRMTVFATDGHLPYPYGRETTGYEVGNLTETLAKAKSAGAQVLVAPYQADGREAAMLQFPGGYIAEVHSMMKK